MWQQQGGEGKWCTTSSVGIDQQLLGERQVRDIRGWCGSRRVGGGEGKWCTTSSVGIDQQLLGESLYRVLRDYPTAGNDGGGGALCDKVGMGKSIVGLGRGGTL